MSPTITERHDKQLSKMERSLHLQGYTNALKALAHVRQIEAGRFRKDRETPRFHHQLSIARLVHTLTPHLAHPETTLVAAFLHDLMEDHDTSEFELRHHYGTEVANAVWKLTKKHRGESKSYEDYFAELATCPVASVVKLADRVHNIQTMQGVFGPEKQRAYVEEVSEWFFPLIREARRIHPRQYDAYENLKILLRCQVDLLRHILRESP
jgi:(p)ppGpp synthase/HD superfamily hydrolase